MYTTHHARLTTGLCPFIELCGRQDINGNFNHISYLCRLLVFLFLHTHVPLFTKQYNLVPCEGFMLTCRHVAAIHGSNEQGK